MRANPTAAAAPVRADRWLSRIGSSITYAVCTALDRHSPEQPIKADGRSFYAQCHHCGRIITRVAPALWRKSHAVNHAAFSGMRDIT